MFGLDDVLSAGLGLVGDLFTGGLNNDASQARQDSANTFSAQQYATRYQTSVKDMEAAGLNPMLAYSQGPGSAPSGAVVNATPYGSGSAAINQSRMASAQVANIAADTENKKAQADLIEAQASQARSSAYRNNADIEHINAQVKEITQKLENNYYGSDVERLKAVAKELQSRYDLNIQHGKTAEQSRLLMFHQAMKLDAETDLLNLDKKAADDLGNLGREAGQLKPAFDILRGLIRR